VEAGRVGEFHSGSTGMDAEELSLALVRDERSRSLHVPDNFHGFLRHDYKVYAYGDATGGMRRIESPGKVGLVDRQFRHEREPRQSLLVHGWQFKPVRHRVGQSMNGKFQASNGDRSLWISDSHCPELCIDLDETVWKPDGSASTSRI
jgi:hypothetical protein